MCVTQASGITQAGNQLGEASQRCNSLMHVHNHHNSPALVISCTVSNLNGPLPSSLSSTSSDLLLNPLRPPITSPSRRPRSPDMDPKNHQGAEPVMIDSIAKSPHLTMTTSTFRDWTPFQ